MSSMLFLNMLTVSLPIALLILLLLILSKQFGKRVAAKCRYIVWAAVILRLCVPFGAVMLPSMYEVNVPEKVEFTAPQAAIQTDIPVAAVTDAVLTAPPVNHSVPVIDSAAVSVTDKIIEPSDNITAAEQPKPIVADTAVIIRILSYIWLTGAVMFIVCKLTAYNISAASVVRSSKAAGETDIALYKKLCDRYKIKHAPIVLVSGRAASPMLCGYFKPRIILPDIELSQNSLAGILAHELTHYRRRDLWVKLFCVLAESLHWWNPFAHIASKRCNAEMELSCDEAVLAGLDEDARRSYGNVMLDIIKRCGKTKGTLTTQFNPRKNAVKERFYGIMDMTKKKRGLWIIAAVVLICIIAGTVIGCRIGGNTPDYAVYWGYYLRCDNGSDMILIDGYSGDGSLAPCSMTAENDKVSFADLTNGDRIKIEVMLIGETYPMQTTVYGVEKLSDGKRSDIDANILAQLAELGWISPNVYDEESLSEELSSLLSMTVAEIRSIYGEMTVEYSENGPGYPVYSLEKFPGVTVAYSWEMDVPLTDSMIPNELIITDEYESKVSGVSVGDSMNTVPGAWAADSYSVINGTVTMYRDIGACRISLVLASGDGGWNMEIQEDSEAWGEYIKTWLADFAKSPSGTVAQLRIRKLDSSIQYSPDTDSSADGAPIKFPNTDMTAEDVFASYLSVHEWYCYYRSDDGISILYHRLSINADRTFKWDIGYAESEWFSHLTGTYTIDGDGETRLSFKDELYQIGGAPDVSEYSAELSLRYMTKEDVILLDVKSSGNDRLADLTGKTLEFRADQSAFTDLINNTVPSSFTPVTITEFTDESWAKLNYDGKIQEQCREFFYNFVSGKSDIPEYNALGVTDWKITRNDELFNMYPAFIFEFTVTGDSLDALPPGHYIKYINDIRWTVMYDDVNTPTAREHNTDNKYAQMVYSYLSSAFIWDCRDFGEWKSGEVPVNYIIGQHGDSMTYDAFLADAKMLFGIEAVDEEALGGLVYDAGGEKMIQAGGLGGGYFADIPKVNEVGGNYEVIVQLYADINGILPSHRLKYTLGGDGAFLLFEILKESQYEPDGLSRYYTK